MIVIITVLHFQQPLSLWYASHSRHWPTYSRLEGSDHGFSYHSWSVASVCCPSIRWDIHWYHSPTVEAVGYGARAFNASEPHGEWSLPPYIIQALLLLLGPPFFAASIYMVLGRLIGLLDAEKYSLISLKWLTKFFLLGDVASIFAQAIGLLLPTASKMDWDGV